MFGRKYCRLFGVLIFFNFSLQDVEISAEQYPNVGFEVTKSPDRADLCKKLRSIRKDNLEASKIYDKLCRCRTTTTLSTTTTIHIDPPAHVVEFCNYCKKQGIITDKNRIEGCQEVCDYCIDYCSSYGIDVRDTMERQCLNCDIQCNIFNGINRRLFYYDHLITNNSYCKRCISKCHNRGYTIPDFWVQPRSELSERCNWCRDSCSMEQSAHCSSCVSECIERNDFDGPLERKYADGLATVCERWLNKCRNNISRAQYSEICTYWIDKGIEIGVNTTGLDNWSIEKECNICEELCWAKVVSIETLYYFIRNNNNIHTFCPRCIAKCKANDIRVPDFYFAAKLSPDCENCFKLCNSLNQKCLECRENCKCSEAYDEIFWKPLSDDRFKMIASVTSLTYETYYNIGCNNKCENIVYQMEYRECGLFRQRCTEFDVMHPFKTRFTWEWYSYEETCALVHQLCFIDMNSQLSKVYDLCLVLIPWCNENGVHVNDLMIRPNLNGYCSECRDTWTLKLNGSNPDCIYEC